MKCHKRTDCVSYPLSIDSPSPSEVYMWKITLRFEFQDVACQHSNETPSEPPVAVISWGRPVCSPNLTASVWPLIIVSNEALYSTHLMKNLCFVWPLWRFVSFFASGKWNFLSEWWRTTTPWPHDCSQVGAPVFWSGPPPPSHTLGPLNEALKCLLSAAQILNKEQDWLWEWTLIRCTVTDLSILISSICLV